MDDLVARLRLEAAGGSQVAGEAGRAEQAVESLGRSGRQAASGLKAAEGAASSFASQANRAGDAAREAANDFATMWDREQLNFVDHYNRQVASAGAVTSSVGKAAKFTAPELLNLSRQFADVGVTAAMGMNPLMILVQQGPQIGETLAMARARGVGLGAAFAQIGAMVAPIAPAVIGIGVAAGLGFGAAALAARALNKENGDLTKGMGLTEKQLERLKEKGVDTGVTIGDVFKGTFNYIGKAVGPLLEPVKKFFDDLFDRITKGSVIAIKVVVGGFSGGFAAIKATWSQLPAAIGDLVLTAAQRAIGGVTALINAAITQINKLIEAANTAAEKAGIGARLGTIGAVGTPQIANPFAGQAALAGQVGGDAFKAGYAAGGKAVEGVLAGVRDSIRDAGQDRLRKLAGEAGTARTPRTPRDFTDEREAQIAQKIQQAMADELQARLALTDDIAARAAIEKQIIQAQLAAKNAEVELAQARLAQDATDKKISTAKADELSRDLDLVALLNAQVAAHQAQLVDERKSAALRQQAFAIQVAQKETAIALASSQAELKRSSFGRAVAEIDILRAQQQLEKQKLEEVVASADSSEREKGVARARLSLIDQIHAAETKLAERSVRLVDAIGEARGAVQGFKNAISRRDWAGIFDEFARTIELVQAGFSRFGPTGGLLTAGSVAASLVGGRTGRAIGTGLGIAGLGLQAGGLLTSAALPAVGALTPLVGVGAAGSIAGGLAAAGAVLGPIALAAGALYAAAKIFNIGGGRSNEGAGYNLVTGAITGDRRSDQTEQAARSAGDAIKAIEQTLTGAGIGLKDAVNGLVIGTRDQTQIYLRSGRTLTSAIGDSGAAVDTAFRALLDGATYTSDSQKQLVEGALAAGKGFDEIASLLGGFGQAQGIGQRIHEAILQLTDPKGFALSELERAQKAERDSLQAAADAGFLTAEQFTSISAQLARLEGLQLADVMKRFEVAVEDSTAALREQAGSLARSVGDRILELTDPDAFKVKSINDRIDAQIAEAMGLIGQGALGSGILEELERLRTLELDALFPPLAQAVVAATSTIQDSTESLRDWLDRLAVSPSAGLSPNAARAEALRQYERQLAAAATNPEAKAAITGYADRLLAADREATSSAAARQALFAKVQNDIRGLAGLGPLGGQGVTILNLPSIQAVYRDSLQPETDRLVAANDRSREATAAELRALAERFEKGLATQGQITAAALVAIAEAVADQGDQTGELATDLRLFVNQLRAQG